MVGLGWNDRVFNNRVNAVAERVSHFVDLDYIVPACLGLVVADALGIRGFSVVAMQGVCLVEYLYSIHRPLNQYIEKHQGDGDGQIHERAVSLLRAADGLGVMAAVIVSSVFTRCFFHPDF